MAEFYERQNVFALHGGMAQAVTCMGIRTGIAAVSLCAMIWLGIHFSGHNIAHENSWMENQQALCLLAATAAFVCRAGREVLRAVRWFHASLALFCFTLLLREIELESEWWPAWITWLSTGAPRNLSLAGCWMGLLIAARGEMREMYQAFMSWLRSPAGRLMLGGGLCYAATWPFDKGFFEFTRATHMFLEELGDSMASVLVLVSAITTLRQRFNVRERGTVQHANVKIAESVR